SRCLLSGAQRTSNRWPSMMGRNTLHACHQQIGGRRVTDIAKTEDADHPFALVDHRQPADPHLFPLPYPLAHLILLTATMDFRGHHVTRGSAARIEVILCQSFAHDVTISHHSD